MEDNVPMTDEPALAIARIVAQRHVGVVTTSRADYGILRPLLKAIASEPSLSLEIGDRATVGAGAVVTKDVPAGETWVGVPAKRRKRNDAS